MKKTSEKRPKADFLTEVLDKPVYQAGKSRFGKQRNKSSGFTFEPTLDNESSVRSPPPFLSKHLTAILLVSSGNKEKYWSSLSIQ